MLLLLLFKNLCIKIKISHGKISPAFKNTAAMWDFLFKIFLKL